MNGPGPELSIVHGVLGPSSALNVDEDMTRGVRNVEMHHDKGTYVGVLIIVGEVVARDSPQAVGEEGHVTVRKVLFITHVLTRAGQPHCVQHARFLSRGSTPHTVKYMLLEMFRHVLIIHPLLKVRLKLILTELAIPHPKGVRLPAENLVELDEDTRLPVWVAEFGGNVTTVETGKVAFKVASFLLIRNLSVRVGTVLRSHVWLSSGFFDGVLQLVVPKVGILLILVLVPDEGRLGVRVLVWHWTISNPWIRSNNAAVQLPSRRVVIQRVGEDPVVQHKEPREESVKDDVEDCDFKPGSRSPPETSPFLRVVDKGPKALLVRMILALGRVYLGLPSSHCGNYVI